MGVEFCVFCEPEGTRPASSIYKDDMGLECGVCNGHKETAEEAGLKFVNYFKGVMECPECGAEVPLVLDDFIRCLKCSYPKWNFG